MLPSGSQILPSGSQAALVAPKQPQVAVGILVSMTPRYQVF